MRQASQKLDREEGYWKKELKMRWVARLKQLTVNTFVRSASHLHTANSSLIEMRAVSGTKVNVLRGIL
jgi:hypothetical protein